MVPSRRRLPHQFSGFLPVLPTSIRGSAALLLSRILLPEISFLFRGFSNCSTSAGRPFLDRPARVASRCGNAVVIRTVFFNLFGGNQQWQ
jgi:hypothetical protein